MIPGMKIKIQKPYCTSTRHTLSYARVSFVYYLNLDGVQVTRFGKQASFFDPYMTTGMKIKI